MLDDILAHKRREVSEARKRNPLTALQEQISVREHTAFSRAISAQGRVCLIAEIKKASPSRGVIRADFDPLALARDYAAAGASAISVLTDAKYFQGDPSHLQTAKLASRLPVLRKDFIIDEYQIWESAAIGADAILLIVAALSESQLRDCLALASRLALDALVEVHDREQLRTALAAGAHIIGINNRDLKTFTTDLAVTLRLAPEVPHGHIIVSESGIHTRDDVRRVAEAGVNAILVGEALMASPDIPAKIRELIGDQS
ncbi:MAG: indole-3-glycerol phosphate synthase TrpC [Candidatus Abyssobacteria bacterium SURF_17]|uniref:Indole-3-glycerol phosphate synthase n=1 Tax=Candidatus Abyssobacteria bacterium SURF_17 TaxID=2093361 RepID=A0A419F2W5_9BACT|nr:MAG: indole-3-glycerol phosphate synthase TrpC [Candidatus Abyssubacteria bacterium SURF_17]